MQMDIFLCRWGVEKGYTVLPRSSSPSHVRENFDLFDWKMQEEEIDLLDTLGLEETKYAWDPASVLWLLDPSTWLHISLPKFVFYGLMERKDWLVLFWPWQLRQPTQYKFALLMMILLMLFMSMVLLLCCHCYCWCSCCWLCWCCCLYWSWCDCLSFE